jgi:hypothetical protein
VELAAFLGVDGKAVRITVGKFSLSVKDREILVKMEVKEDGK